MVSGLLHCVRTVSVSTPLNDRVKLVVFWNVEIANVYMCHSA